MSETIDTYNMVAESWNNFRQRPFFPLWFDFLVERWKKGSLIDIGCGNGRNLLPFRENFKITGIDLSEKMIQNAKKFAEKKKIKARFLVSDALEIPFKDKSFDYALSIAVYHHMNESEIEMALNELKRILKPGGEAFITVWNRLQKKFLHAGFHKKISWTKKSNNKTYYRDYYFHTPWSIEKHIRKCGFEIIKRGAENSLEKKAFSKNICILAKKPY